MTIEEILAQPDHSVQESFINLDAINYGNRYNVLRQILNKHAIGSTINIGGIDIYSFAEWIIYSKKEIHEINSVIENIKSLDTLDNVKRFLLENHFKTTTFKRDNGQYAITAKHTL